MENLYSVRNKIRLRLHFYDRKMSLANRLKFDF